MWQEAKKQEKILRGIMVDYKRRAERRKGYYDKCKKDPAEFLQLWGRQCKIHIDPSVASAADNPSIMTKWRGDDNTIIDRFDARSHLDYLVEYEDPSGEDPPETLDNEERMLNYERYRTLVQNEAVGITENQCLKQIDLDEKFGGLEKPHTHEKKSKEPKAQIGFVYEDGNIVSSRSQYVNTKGKAKSPSPNFSDDDTDEDLDLALDINKLTSEHKVIINKCATEYGMQYGDYVRMLILDNEEKETLIRNKLLEAEKAQYSGRRSRRERRIAKDKRLKERGSLSPLSYIVKDEPTKEKSTENYGDYFEEDSKSLGERSNSRSRSRSRHKSRTRSRSPSNPKNKVLFITSFGAEDQDDQNESNHHYLNNLNKKKSNSMANALVFNAKLLKNKRSSMSPQSRSPSRSPVKETKVEKSEAKVVFKHSNRLNSNKAKQVDSETSQSSNTSDEEEALKKYLKRKENRKQNINTDDNTAANQSSNNKNGSSKNNEQNSNKNDNKNNERSSLNSKNSNLNKEDTNSQSKFRTAEEFKIYQEKLKKKMQKQINKQLKQDQKLEKEKRRKEYDERREREAKLSYLTEKMRERHKKERRRNREANGIYTSSSDGSSRSRSHSPNSSRMRSRSRSPNHLNSRKKSRSRSRTRESHSHRKHSRSSSREKRRLTNKSRSRSKSPKKSTRRDSSSSSSSSSSSKMKSSVIVLKSAQRSSSSSSSSRSPSPSKSKKRVPLSSSSSSSSSSNSPQLQNKRSRQTHYRSSKRSSRSSS